MKKEKIKSINLRLLETSTPGELAKLAGWVRRKLSGYMSTTDRHRDYKKEAELSRVIMSLEKGNYEDKTLQAYLVDEEGIEAILHVYK